MRRLADIFGRPAVERGPLVLVYHRVGEPALDPWSLSVKPRNFVGHMREISRRAAPTSLEGMMRSLAAGTLAQNAVAVTFDDGYADNLHVAAPVLSEFSVPATVFVTTGNIGTGREFWWDEIERILLKTTRPLLSLLPDDPESGFRATVRSVYLRLWEGLNYLGDDERRARLEEIRVRAVVDDEPRGSYLSVSEEELVRLSESVEVGAHTVTHPALADLPNHDQRTEVRGSRAYLERLLSRRVGAFSYPHGSCSRETVEVVREAGFDCACVLSGRPVASGCDLLQIPRVMVGDWSRARFGIWLSRWLGRRERP